MHAGACEGPVGSGCVPTLATTLNLFIEGGLSDTREGGNGFVREDSMAVMQRPAPYLRGNQCISARGVLTGVHQ